MGGVLQMSDPRYLEQQRKKWGQMPAHYHEQDGERIAALLSGLNAIERVKVCAAYAKVYQETHDAEPLEHKRANKARFAANTRLRIYINKKFNVFG